MVEAQPCILVTGAGGFIGSHVSMAIPYESFRVRSGARRQISAIPPNREWVRCDLDLPAEVEAALTGVDLVVHAAYGNENAMPQQAESLLDAMSKAGVTNLVAFSSIAVYGQRQGLIAENCPPAPPLSDYARAKSRCEELYSSWASENPSRRVIALRPGIVYGEGSKYWIDKMVQRIQSGGWGVMGPQGNGRAALIHVDDLSTLCLAAIEQLLHSDRDRWGPFEALNCVGPETPSWNAYFQALAEQLGKPPLRRWSPMEIRARQILALPAKAAARAGFPVPWGLALAPLGGELGLFGLDVQISGEKARRMLGFAPKIGLAAGLAASSVGAHHETSALP